MKTFLTKALRSKRGEVFLSVLGSCYTTLDAKLFEDAATFLPGYIGTYPCIVHFDIHSVFTNIHVLSVTLLPVTSVSKWCDHKASSVSKVFISILHFSSYHSNNHGVFLPVISQLPYPLKVIGIQKIMVCQVSNYITT